MDVKLGEFLGDAASLRTDGREVNELRPFRIEAGVQQYAEGSAMVEMGRTKVLCTATVEERVPPFMRGQGTGWVTAEYAMLPRSSPVRISRESSTGRVKGRTHEIQRLIGRALRGVTDLSCLGERQVLIDCDVLVADGGTRTASITGAWVAFAQAIQMLHKKRVISKDPLLDQIAAISVGVVDSVPMLDLCYEEDSSAEVDMNIVMTRSGKYVEVQGTAETAPFTDEQLQQMLAHGRKGIDELLTAQRDALTSVG
jgi:ribonuclease PH